MGKKKVYIAYTGGTIGMKPSSNGFVTERGYFGEQIKNYPELYHPDMPDFELHEYEHLIDSADITPQDWYQISQDIESNFDDFDGFIVLHGTDTMAYTSSALSFMLEDLSKPVIVTGSQIPWSEMRSDGKENLVTSLLLAANYNIPEVGLFFHNRLYRGNRVRKLDATGFYAFQSPNFPALVEAGTKIDVKHDLLLKDPQKMLRVRHIAPPKVVVLSLFPGFPGHILKSLFESDIKGLVLMTYGMGNAPSEDEEMLQLLEQASGKGVVIVNCTQCNKGIVDMNGYATGKALLNAGVINGFDMTPEATMTKLSYLLSCDLEIDEIKRLMQTSLRGELTV
ncbi:MAG: asparaginase [Gammaproteobacteria bacterium]|nr:asparaginase [Gammaproteobacteria bacterium]